MKSYLETIFPCRLNAGSETESEAGDVPKRHFDERNDKMNSDDDPSGYLRMVSRNNIFNG